jgi:subtilisin family serine protease
VLSFAAAGNDNTDQPFYPAAFGEFVVAVAGTDESDTKWSLSNYGDWIELSAPAVGVVSTLPGNGYGEMTGTSQASAVASGAAALVWSHCQTMSTEQVRRRLQESAVDLGDAGRDPYFGYGRVDLFSALSAPCPIPVGGTILAQGRTENVIFELLVAIVMPCLGLLAVTLIYRRSYRRPGKPLRC